MDYSGQNRGRPDKWHRIEPGRCLVEERAGRAIGPIENASCTTLPLLQIVGLRVIAVIKSRENDFLVDVDRSASVRGALSVRALALLSTDQVNFSSVPR